MPGSAARVIPGNRWGRAGVYGNMARLLIQFACTLLALHLPSAQESFETRHARELTANPNDLHFRLDTTDGHHTFRIGERIRLKLSFSSDAPDKYKLNGATYDRSGRLPTEEFILDRANAVRDPYIDYFGPGIMGGLAGGLRTYPVLNTQPYDIEVDLNDWFRFDSPGTYRFYLKSHRLARERLPGEAKEALISFAAVSNAVEIRMVDDAAWAAAKLDEIRQVLQTLRCEQAEAGQPCRDAPGSDERLALAERDLCYLATPAAVELAFEQAHRTGSRPSALLLTAARNRPHMLAQFDRYLEDPATTITEWDIRLRALFTYVAQERPAPLPLHPWQISNQEEWPKLRAVAEDRYKRFERFVEAEAVRLIAAVTRKSGNQRRESAKTISALARKQAAAAGLLEPENYGLTRAELIARFTTFPPERRQELLHEKWDAVRGPEMVAPLKELILATPPRALPKSAMTLQVWGTGSGEAESALRRLAELAPAEVEAILRHDLATTELRFAGFAVREFPSRDMPETDTAFSALLQANFGGALPLVARFGTAKLAGEVRAGFEQRRRWPCAEEEMAVAYFVRVFPAVDGEGRKWLQRAMENRENRGCYRWLLHRVASITWNAAIEAEAIARLNDPDAETAASAAEVLKANGGPDVEPYLWKRLEAWSDRWRGRAGELRENAITGAKSTEDGKVGFALFQAIGTAQAWLLDEPRRRRLVALCLDDWCRKQWSEPLSHRTRFQVTAANGGALYPPGFQVAGVKVASLERLEQKLAQHPAGTTFFWCPSVESSFDQFSPGQRDQMFQRLSAFLSQRSMSIEPYSKKSCSWDPPPPR